MSIAISYNIPSQAVWEVVSRINALFPIWLAQPLSAFKLKKTEAVQSYSSLTELGSNDGLRFNAELWKPAGVPHLLRESPKLPCHIVEPDSQV